MACLFLAVSSLKLTQVMKKVSRFLVACFALTALTLFAGSPPITITVTTTFDYPGTGNSTFPYGINNSGDIAGYYVDTNLITRGFTRLHTGVFSNPIVEPNDTGGFTRAFGINRSRNIDGDFFNVADNTYHGYFRTGHSYTQFDFPASESTDLFGLNDAGDFCGAGLDSVSGIVQAYVSIGGTSSIISLPAGATLGSAHGMNNSDEVVGIYEDSAGNFHGFLRDTNGTVISPIDYPGAVSTTPQGISDRGIIVGRYNNADLVLHAFILKLPHTFISYDYPGATATSFNDINIRNTIAARYTDTGGVAHGFIAQLQ